MRRAAIAGWLFVLLLLPAFAGAQQSLASFAERLGLRDVAGFVTAVEVLRREHHLPPGYISKRSAAAMGWHGGGLCAAAPGHAIGGEVFHDAGSPLPRAPGRVYREADLDETCDSRGPKRLVFSNDGMIYVTPDHYRSFVPVP